MLSPATLMTTVPKAPNAAPGAPAAAPVWSPSSVTPHPHAPALRSVWGREELALSGSTLSAHATPLRVTHCQPPKLDPSVSTLPPPALPRPFYPVPAVPSPVARWPGAT